MLDTKPHIPLSELRYIWLQAWRYYTYNDGSTSDVFRGYVADEVNRRIIAALREELATSQAQAAAAQQGRGAAWDEDRIVDSIQAKSTDEPRIDVYNQVEWVTDDVAIGLAMEVYKDMRAEIDALQAQLAAAQTGTYQPITGNITFARNGNLFVMDANALDGLPFPDGVRLCALQPGSPLGKGGDEAPDWSTAPEWAKKEDKNG